MGNAWERIRIWWYYATGGDMNAKFSIVSALGDGYWKTASEIMRETRMPAYYLFPALDSLEDEGIIESRWLRTIGNKKRLPDYHLTNCV